MASMVDYVSAAGHRNIVYVNRDDPAYWLTERLTGFRQGMARNGHRVSERSVVHGTTEELRDRVRRLFARKRRPDAVVCADDSIAAMVTGVARSAGLTVGTDVALTGCDGGALQRLNDPTLTSVRIPVEVIAERLLERCLREVESGPTGDPGEIVPAELVRGGSG